MRNVARIVRLAKPAELVSANGWVTSVRKMKNCAFADLTDGSSPEPLNVVLDPAQADKLNTGACVLVEGTIKESPGKQRVELVGEKVRVLGSADDTYPLQKKYHSPEFLRQLPQYRWRTRTAAQVLRYRSWALTRLHEFFTSEDVVQVSSPIITSSDCEGAGETFSLAGSREFFGKQAYLSVSSQLHLEVFTAALSRVWNFTPAFRAEASDTNRHLSEFWMVEAELAFVNEVHEVTSFCERMIRAVVPTGQMRADILASKRDQALRTKLEARWSLLSGPWSSISYSKAVDILEGSFRNGRISAPLKWGDGISSEQEKFLAGTVFKGPVFVTDYPAAIKPFYMKRSADGDHTVACFDLLIPEVGELVGGSLREDNYETLLGNIKRANMNADVLAWYLDLRKHGSFPHGGYGMGFERLVMYICGMDNIRDAIGFVRGFNACKC